MEKRIFRTQYLSILTVAVLFTVLFNFTATTVKAQTPKQSAGNNKIELTTFAFDTDSLLKFDADKVLSTGVSATSDKPAAANETREVKIVVNLPAYTLSFIENGKVIKTFPVAIASPRYVETLGTRQASQLIWNPSWTPPDSPWARNEKPTAPGAANNPLGRAKIRLGGNYLIHGGGDKSVGHAVSHGCIRMRNDDVLELVRLIVAARQLPISEKQLLKVETNRTQQFGIKIDPAVTVEIEYRPLTVENGKVEIHPDVYHHGTNNIDNLKETLVSAGIHYEKLSMEEQLSLVRALRDSKTGRQTVELGIEDQVSSLK